MPWTSAGIDQHGITEAERPLSSHFMFVDKIENREFQLISLYFTQ